MLSREISSVERLCSVGFHRGVFTSHPRKASADGGKARGKSL